MGEPECLSQHALCRVATVQLPSTCHPARYPCNHTPRSLNAGYGSQKGLHPNRRARTELESEIEGADPRGTTISSLCPLEMLTLVPAG